MRFLDATARGGKSTMLGVVANRLRSDVRVRACGRQARHGPCSVACEAPCVRADRPLPVVDVRRPPLPRARPILGGLRPCRRAQDGAEVRRGPDAPHRPAVHGQRTAYRLAVALATDVPYLLLDEPVLGLDANARELFYRLLLEDYLEKQRTVIVATHLIEEVANLVEQVTVIDRGRLLLQASADELRASGHSVTAAQRTWMRTAKAATCWAPTSSAASKWPMCVAPVTPRRRATVWPRPR